MTGWTTYAGLGTYINIATANGGNAGFAACTLGKLWVSKTVADATNIADLVSYLQALSEIA